MCFVSVVDLHPLNFVYFTIGALAGVWITEDEMLKLFYQC